MLFMGIFTYEPEKRTEVIKRRAEKGPMAEGNIIGEWGSVAGSFHLFLIFYSQKEWEDQVNERGFNLLEERRLSWFQLKRCLIVRSTPR
jgi:hypothetical protein